jgi:hypothetical protein
LRTALPRPPDYFVITRRFPGAAGAVGALCVIVTVWPPIKRAPVRFDVLVFEATV